MGLSSMMMGLTISLVIFGVGASLASKKKTMLSKLSIVRLVETKS